MVGKKKNELSKNDLVAIIAESTGYAEYDVGTVVNHTLKAIQNSLAEGMSVNIVGFGKFSTSFRDKKEMRSPFSGEMIMVEAKRLPRFRAGAKLREAVKEV